MSKRKKNRHKVCYIRIIGLSERERLFRAMT
jgi:hypothetical protein